MILFLLQGIPATEFEGVCVAFVRVNGVLVSNHGQEVLREVQEHGLWTRGNGSSTQCFLDKDPDDDKCYGMHEPKSRRNSHD